MKVEKQYRMLNILYRRTIISGLKFEISNQTMMHLVRTQSDKLPYPFRMIYLAFGRCFEWFEWHIFKQIKFWEKLNNWSYIRVTQTGSQNVEKTWKIHSCHFWRVGRSDWPETYACPVSVVSRPVAAWSVCRDRSGTDGSFQRIFPGKIIRNSQETFRERYCAGWFS